MSQTTRAWVLLLAMGGWPWTGAAQSLTSSQVPDVLLSTRFVTPLTYETALTRLGSYYQEQVGRILPLSFPEIAPGCHFEAWHDIWVFFASAGGQTTVTLKRPTEGINSRLVKGWMLELAGRLEAEMPLGFTEEPPLREVESDIEASRNDLARVLGTATGMKPVATWLHAGLMVSAAPLRRVVLAPAGLRGGHRVKVGAESAVEAKQLLAQLMLGVLKPGIYAAYSEEVELEGEVHNRASGKSAVSEGTPQAVIIPNVDEKYLQDRVRAEPEMMRRSAAAVGQYSVRFRVDSSYRKVIVSWVELGGYSRATSRYADQRALGQSIVSNPKAPVGGGGPLTARARLPRLGPGAYRVRLEGESADGKSEKIDERTYWFDGKTFEEI
jgi:hypothetical protein